jgi:hypothetical protein
MVLVGESIKKMYCTVAESFLILHRFRNEHGGMGEWLIRQPADAKLSQNKFFINHPERWVSG